MSANCRQVYLPAGTPPLGSMTPALQQRFAKARVVASQDEVNVTFGDWTARVVDFRETWVAEEARELVARAPAEARAGLQAATHRLEIYDTGDADADDAHYNDGLLLFEYFLGTGGAVGLDPVSGEFFSGKSNER